MKNTNETQNFPIQYYVNNESGKVEISLEHYNELRDTSIAFNKIKDEGVSIISSEYYHSRNLLIVDDDAIREIVKQQTEIADKYREKYFNSEKKNAKLKSSLTYFLVSYCLVVFVLIIALAAE